MNDEQLLRYSRQILLPEIEIDGQEKLLQAKVLIIGAGGLGSPIALYLAASGIGHITIADDDCVELSNLQRQIAHQNNDIGINKATSAKAKMLALNPTIEVDTIETRLTSDQFKDQVGHYDLVIDATDNYASRIIINKHCVATKTPAIFGAAIRLEGQVLVYDGNADSACYACLYKDIGDDQLSCAVNGVAAPVVGIIGTMQAMEAIRLLLNLGKSSANCLHIFDARDMQWQKLKLPKSKHCDVCS